MNSVYSNAVSFDSDFINDFSNDNECEITSIIGSDGRTKITTTTTYLYFAILYIEISWPDGATGLETAFMIDDNLAATAGHCVYDASHGGWAESIKVWPGKKGYGILNNPYGTANATNFHTSIPWTENADSKYDWGLIELDENIGEDTGWFILQKLIHKGF